MESVDVLEGIDRRDNVVGVLSGKGELNENSVNVLTRIKLFDFADEVLSWSVCRIEIEFKENPRLFTRLLLETDVQVRCWIITNQQDGKSRLLRERGDARLDLLANP